MVARDDPQLLLELAEDHRPAQGAHGRARRAADLRAHARKAREIERALNESRLVAVGREEGVDAVRQFGETLEDRIRHAPIKSVLIAAGAGFLLSMMMGRR